jgi:hypothetical protein
METNKDELSPTRQEIMNEEYSLFLSNTVDYSLKGALYGLAFGLIFSKNKGSGMLKFGALGMGVAAGYSY